MIGQCMARDPAVCVTRCVRWTPEDADMTTILIFGAIEVIGQISTLRDWLKRPPRPTHDD